MVCRLVKKQDVGLCEKKLSKGDTGLLAAGEGFNLLGKLILPETKSFEDSRDLALIGVAIGTLEFCRQAVIGLHKALKPLAGEMFHLHLHLPETPFRFDNLCFGGLNFPVDGIIPGHVLMLGEVT